MAISHADLVDKLSVVAARAVGGPTLTLATGKGALVAAGSPTADAPMPIIVYRGATYLTILRCEGVSGDVLTINGTMFGKADAAINVGDVAYNAPTAGDLKALWDAIAAVETTPGPKGDQGDPGTPGSVWRDGSGAPADSLGVDGDYYLDDATGAVYLKASGAYSQVADIKGAQGDQGPAGADGATGPAGVGSFGVSMPAGFAVTNSPLTSSGTIAVSTTLSGMLKGTGSGFAAAAAGTDYVAPGSDITGKASNVTGVVAIDHGGTGLATLGSANQILGMDSTGAGMEHKTLTAGSNVTITHGAGAVTIAASASGLTSVGLSMPGGFTVAGSPLTANGTLAVTTSLSGLLKAGSGSFSTATPGADYVVPSGSITGTASNVTGTVAVANGGTGLTSLGTANQVLAVNAAGTALEYQTPSSGGGADLHSLTVSDDGATVTVSTAESKLILQQTGDVYGTTSLALTNRNGANGATFQTSNAAADLVDFAFQSFSKTSTLRMEGRDASTVLGTAPEFQFGGFNNSALVVGPPFGGAGVSGRLVVASVDDVVSPPNADLDLRGSLCLKGAVATTTPYTSGFRQVLTRVQGPASARSITLPSFFVACMPYIVKDEAGDAATNNITVYPPAGGSIDGAASAVINTNYGCLLLYCQGANVWSIVSQR